MSRICCLLLAALIVGVALPQTAQADTPTPSDGGLVVDGAQGRGDSFGFGAVGTSRNGNTGGGSGASPASMPREPVCWLEPVEQLPLVLTDEHRGPATPGYWKGHTPDQGTLVHWVCEPGTTPADLRSFFLINAAAPPPDPGVVAVQAMNKIGFPAPVPHVGPDTELAVKRWNYLWVDDPGPLAATAAVPGLSVTATATLVSSSWSLGEWTDLNDRTAVPPVVCAGAGQLPPPSAEWNVSRAPSTSCAAWYQWRSLPDRTGGSGTWPLTVSTTWTIDWIATNGAAGTAIRTQVSAPLRVAVGEWRAVERVPGEPLPTEGRR
jgi:hypothetical protein